MLNRRGFIGTMSLLPAGVMANYVLDPSQDWEYQPVVGDLIEIEDFWKLKANKHYSQQFLLVLAYGDLVMQPYGPDYLCGQAAMDVFNALLNCRWLTETCKRWPYPIAIEYMPHGKPDILDQCYKNYRAIEPCIWRVIR